MRQKRSESGVFELQAIKPGSKRVTLHEWGVFETEAITIGSMLELKAFRIGSI